MTRSEIDEIFAASAPPKKKIKTTKQPETFKKQQRRREKKDSKADNDRFKDSRGTTSRRKTADGYTIYKEDELGISTTGGDTPLCPFDCQCCWSFPPQAAPYSSLLSPRFLVSLYAILANVVRILPVARLYRSLADPALVAMVCKVNV